MSYRKFNLQEVVYQFNLELKKVKLFENVKPVAMGNAYLKTLQKGLKIALPSGSEKVRNELIVMPILLELHDNNNELFSIHSGVNLNVDKQKGLTGECDFILSLSAITTFVDAPIFCIVEAKKQDIEAGLGQCSAQMVGAWLWNQKHKKAINTIFGCVTTGSEWYFLKLEDNCLTLDNREYNVRNTDELLGVFQTIINRYFKNEK